MGDWLSEVYQRSALIRWTVGILVAPIGGVVAVSWTPLVIFAFFALPAAYAAWVVGIPLFAWLQRRAAPGYLYSVCGLLLGVGTIAALMARAHFGSTNPPNYPPTELSSVIKMFSLYFGLAAAMGAATGWFFWLIAIRPALSSTSRDEPG